MIKVPISYGGNTIEVEISEGSLIKELKMNDTPPAAGGTGNRGY